MAARCRRSRQALNHPALAACALKAPGVSGMRFARFHGNRRQDPETMPAAIDRIQAQLSAGQPHDPHH
jgi:hypothetical protein